MRPSTCSPRLLAPGARSPATTPGWAAPEQVSGGNVQCSTDQYALGVMLRQVRDGVIYGAEATYIVPASGKQTERFKLLRNPGVYLEPDCMAAGADGIELAQEIRAAVEEVGVRGQLPMTPWFGTLEEYEDGQQPIWQVQDLRN